uniref:N-acylneuraminate-9-phosphatase n=1 Tax=Pyramimonas obovata TaxID=1411642 RepID=A0A7S0WQT8_9CHLO|mmetsp:Transcript_35467/g.77449  ORF Transcript_35467/g.77449 Transcript_35467/m.77449 type:complete len:248 (+) Transcript_35467:72-815(+)|eukprot:CAMPEP_0118934234 /NCGR_PEP_ID=MMETSP1169-20130426/13711_1 /TAXON_ID=36882 /ORGANISM="Pyramimonas obovata, Strain CCMP722" /LENGTH=247 /DNA_ID=CAMNT_0006877115 /DNA_START=21 /DNA_END=764 /DNA_ORIENTATION=+
MTIKAAFFDLDDTLVLTGEADKRAFAALSALAKSKNAAVDTDALITAFKKRFKATPWDVTYKVEVTEWRAGMWLESLQEQNINDKELADAIQKCFDDTRLGDFPFIPGTKEMLASFKERGVKVVIITNGHHFIQHEKLKACKAADLFEYIIVGGDEVLAGRKEKPDAGIFQKACAMAGVSAEEAVHVGDSLSTDVQGGINAGLAATIWVSKSLADPPAEGPQPTFTVRTATETIDCIDKLEQRPVEE